MIEGQECITIPGPPLSSSAAVEVQEFYALAFLKRRTFAASGRRERRHPPKVRPRWPRLESWGDPTQAHFARLDRKVIRAFSPRKVTKAAIND